MTTDDFTIAARAEAEQKWPYSANPDPTLAESADAALNAGFVAGAVWARDHLAAQEPTDTAQIIDEHRAGSRFVGFGVTITCACGESVRGESPVGPQTDEDNAHRDAERKHAAHVADVLARAARRDEEKR